MNKAKLWIALLLSSITLTLSACGQPVTTGSDTPALAAHYENEIKTVTSLNEGQPSPAAAPLSSSQPQEISLPQEMSSPQESTFSLSAIAPYAGQPYITVNGNIPYFEEEDLIAQSYETYSELDDLGRCRVACASIGVDLMPTEERGNIGQVKPTGWHLVKYDIVEGKYLYNRCHLIGYQLSGENANEKNLITGTRYLNVQGMLPFENMVADYVKESENHVLYRVTPIFEGDNLLASGVLMEAESVEDKGESILFCVYVYNVQPGIAIDYVTGESSLDTNTPGSANTHTPVPDTAAPESSAPGTAATEPSSSGTAATEPSSSGTAATEPSSSGTAATEPSSSGTAATEPSSSGTAADSTASSAETIIEPQPQVPQESEPQGTTYILNTNTKKFHYPSCSTIEQMKESNKEEYTGDRENIISQGYVPCKKCNP